MVNFLKSLNAKLGMSFIEMVVVMTFASIIIASCLVFNAPLKYNNSQAEKRFIAFNLISAQAEDLKYTSATDWASPDLNAGTNYRAQTTNIIVPAGYTLQYQITDFIDWAEDDDIHGNDTGGAEYKRVSIKCSYPISETTITSDIAITGFLVHP